jgi:hypothetical protein
MQQAGEMMEKQRDGAGPHTGKTKADRMPAVDLLSELSRAESAYQDAAPWDEQAAGENYVAALENFHHR